MVCRFGERDPVLPAYESAVIYGPGAAKAFNADATMVIFHQGNHRILISASGDFVPGYLDLLAYWAARRVPTVKH